MVAGVWGQARFKRGNPCFLLLNDSEQADDERCLFPTGGI
jgi:hypothetical protein